MPADAVDLLTDLVSIPSPSTRERKAVEHLVEWLGAEGLNAAVDEAGNAVGVKGAGPREILLLGHIDTVPGDIPVRREGDILHGRGSVDAKGALCAMAAAVSGTAVPDGWRVTVVGAVEEECATSRGARHVIGARPTPPACCVIGEPSRWDRITVGYRGRLLADVSVRSPVVHSAGADRLTPEIAVEFWNRVQQDCDAFNEDAGAARPFESLSPSLRRIHSRDDGVHGQVDMRLGFRLPLSLEPDAMASRLGRLIDDLAGPGDVTIETSLSGAEAACRAGKSNALVRAFLAAIREAGEKPRFVVKAGTSDMNVVAAAWPGVPVVAYGPGDSALDHTPGEKLDLGEYRKSIDVLKGVLDSLMVGNEHGVA